MSTAEIEAFYQKQIAGMTPQEQLQLAHQILERLAKDDSLYGEDAGVILQRQKAELEKICGILEGGDPDASIRHDEILYGPARS